MQNPAVAPSGYQPSAQTSRDVKAWPWLLGFGAFWIVAGLAMTFYWYQRKESAIAAVQRVMPVNTGENRAALEAAWGDLLRWAPAPGADPALAITPRATHKDFESVYTLYEGDVAKFSVAFTTFGAFTTDARLNAKRHPETFLARRLADGELDALRRMIPLMDERMRLLDAQSKLYGWTEYNKGQLELLLEMQTR
jgi:hypothetical protein